MFHVHWCFLLQCGCPGGGVPPKPPKGWKGKDGNDKHNRVDSYGSTANGAFRGSHLPGCSSMTYWINTGDLLCPRCVQMLIMWQHLYVLRFRSQA
jgi:hypothetical protein